MSGGLRGLTQINYQSHHQYYTSVGTTLLILSYLAIFGYITAVYSFTGGVNISHIIFLLIPAAVGFYMIDRGLGLWEDDREQKDKMRDAKHREQQANAEIAEKQAELLEKAAQKAQSGSFSVDGTTIVMEDLS